MIAKLKFGIALLAVVAGAVPLLGARAAVLVDLHARQEGVPLATPIEKGGLRPVPMAENGIPFLRQPCRFSAGIGREGWDFPVNWDLRRGRGIRFQIRCADTSSVSYFACYFRSGNGWYRSEFSIQGTGRWEPVEILKAGTGVEGRPTGWRRIDRMRICAWRSGNRNTSFDLAAPEHLDAPLSVIVARGLSALDAGKDGELALVVRQARLVASLLAANGVEATFMEDVDLAAGGVPAGTRLVALPYNPGLAGGIEQALLAFRRGGGGIVGFFTMPPAMQQAFGIRETAYLNGETVAGGFGGIALVGKGLAGAPRHVLQTSWGVSAMSPSLPTTRIAAQWTRDDGAIHPHPAILAAPGVAWMSHILRNEDPEAGGKLLLAMLGHAWDGVWSEAVEKRWQTLGQRIHPAGFAAALSWLDESAGRQGQTAARREIALARTHEQQASSQIRSGNQQGAMASLAAAESALRNAFMMIQPAVAGEFRGVWCHRGYGVRGWSWDESIKRLSACGFNAVMPNIANASRAWYPSAFLDPPPAASGGADYLGECLNACQRYRVQCHPWLACFRVDDAMPPEQIKAFSAAGRFQRTASGKVDTQWLCPVNPANRRQMLGVVGEILGKYPVDGIHLDFIRLPGSQHCFCPHCRTAFEQTLGGQVPDWPGAVAGDGPLSARWQDFRVATITSFVAETAAIRNRIRPDAKVSVAVFADSRTARKSVAQDWPGWVKAGHVDFVCPMDYTADAGHLAQMVSRQLGLAGGKVPVYPGIGLSANHLDAVDLVKQIGVCRRANTGGFMIFEYDREEALGPFADLAKGITRTPRNAKDR